MKTCFRRILVVGTVGSGKTTLAGALADMSGLPHIELDQLKYARDWQDVPTDVFRRRVESRLQDDSWILDGNYAAVRDIAWGRAELVVWMDYPLPIVLGRLLRRTLRRLMNGDDVGGGNRERLGRLLGRRSILLWAVRSHRPLRQEYELAMAAPRSNDLYVLRHRYPSETRAWLRAVKDATPALRDEALLGPPCLRWHSGRSGGR